MAFTNKNVQGNEDSRDDMVLGKSIEYQDLLHQLEREQKLLDRTPEGDIQERLEISARVNELISRIVQLKKNILGFAEQFQQIKINSDRLKRAKGFFDKGQLGEARAALECELEQVQNEQRVLLSKREEYEQHILPKLQANAEEFLILALSMRNHYENPNWFNDTCRYFEDSIKSYANKDNIFDFAYFLKAHNKLDEAEKYYQRYLNDFSSDLSRDEYAIALNNLGNLHQDQNKYEEALGEYEETLKITRELAKFNPSTYLSDVALTLNNLASLHQDQNKYEEALKEYEEALEIRRELAKFNPSTYLAKVAGSLNNLGNLHQEQKKYEESLKEYEEALEIYRKLAKTDPETYLSYVATILNNLASQHQEQKKYEESLSGFVEALGIRRELAKVNPTTYLPEVAKTIMNLSIYYQKAVPQRERSINYVIHAVRIVWPYVEKVPHTQRVIRSAATVLEDWGLSLEEAKKLILDSSEGKD